MIELTIKGAKNETQARKIGKSILNSPLVKTAVYGGDPNWGRLVMAVGKVFEEPIPFESLQIYFGTLPVKEANPEILKKLSEYLKNNTEISLNVMLNIGTVSMKFWGCDFSEEYIKENAYYTT